MIVLIDTSPHPPFPHVPKLAERVIPVLLDRPVIKALGAFNIFDPSFTRHLFPLPEDNINCQAVLYSRMVSVSLSLVVHIEYLILC